MLILVDLDGVLAGFDEGFIEKWRKQFPDEPYFTLEERTTFYVHEQYVGREQMVRQITSAPGFFRELPPIADGFETIHQLVAYGHEVLICTAPLSGTPTCMQEKYDWVKMNLGKDFASTMVITKDKTMIRGDILIDDRPKVPGRFEPTWEHILFHQPYNASVCNRRRMTCWKDGVDLFCR